MIGHQAEKEVWRYLQPSGYNKLTLYDGQTDRHVATEKERAYE